MWDRHQLNLLYKPFGYSCNVKTIAQLCDQVTSKVWEAS